MQVMALYLVPSLRLGMEIFIVTKGDFYGEAPRRSLFPHIEEYPVMPVQAYATRSVTVSRGVKRKMRVRTQAEPGCEVGLVYLSFYLVPSLRLGTEARIVTKHNLYGDAPRRSLFAHIGEYPIMRV